MVGPFFQSEDSEDFEWELNLFNSFLDREEGGAEMSAGEALELAGSLEVMGLYEKAESVIGKVPDGERTDEIRKRAGVLREKKEKKDAVLRKNFEKNVAALEESLPHLSLKVKPREDREILIAGGLEEGYRLLAREGYECEDITFPDDGIAEFRNGLVARLEEVKAQKSIIFSNFLYCDVFLWFAAETKRTRRESELVIYVVEREQDIFAAVLKTHDLSDLFLQKRLVPFVGDDFAKQIAEWFDRNVFTILPRIFVLEGDLWDEVMSSFEKVNVDRREKTVRLLKDIKDYYNGISGEEWRARFEGGPLKILVPSARFSTFARHCARDVARAFERLGHTAEVHIAPNDACAENEFTLLSHVDSFRPDLIFEINLTRDMHQVCINLEGGREERLKEFPDSLPVVTWDQDTEGSLFSSPQEVGPRDFIFTVFKEDYMKAGFGPGDVSVLPIVASEEVFYPMELTDEDMDKYGCEVSFVCNIPFWSEVMESAEDPLNRALFSHLRGMMEADLNSVVSVEEYEEAVKRVAKEAGMSAGGDADEYYARRMRLFGVGRLLTRSLPMEWIAEAGFDLRLYGNGWDEAPSLAAYARGPVENGPLLCKVFRASAINISTSTVVSLHQRVIECMLAGGFVLVRHMPPEKDKLSVYDFFEAGSEFDVFKNKKDLIEKIKYYLENEERRKEIAERGRRKALEKLTYYRQMEFVLDVVRKKFLSSI
ncbi:MAG: glycosyltransferase [bacterium]